MDVDVQIAALARLPNPDLDGIDGVRLAARAAEERRQSRVMITSVLVSALLIGAASGMAPATEARASAMLFGPPLEMMPLVQMARE